MSTGTTASQDSSQTVDRYFRAELPELLTQVLGRLQFLRDPVDTREDQRVENPLKALIYSKGDLPAGAPLLNLQHYEELHATVFETFVRSLRSFHKKDSSPPSPDSSNRDLVYVHEGASHYYRIHFYPKCVLIERLMTIRYPSFF